MGEGDALVSFACAFGRPSGEVEGASPLDATSLVLAVEVDLFEAMAGPDSEDADCVGLGANAVPSAADAFAASPIAGSFAVVTSDCSEFELGCCATGGDCADAAGETPFFTTDSDKLSATLSASGAVFCGDTGAALSFVAGVFVDPFTGASILVVASAARVSG
ncbi:MAG: hypothetical protein H6875_08400 [Hyphomicrobiaceae bacterium]|nr:hypothetical protein [Hyphomicrobiaceae bacterium]